MNEQGFGFVPFDRKHTTGSGRPLDLREAARVDARTAADLVTGVRDLAASVIEPGLSRAERVARAERANEAAAGLNAWAHVLDPYRDGRHARLLDMLTLAGSPGREYRADPDAADRVALAEAHDRITHQLRAIVTGPDVAGLYGTPDASPLPWPSATPVLDQLARPAAQGVGPSTDYPGPWSDIPTAVIGWDDPLPEGTAPNVAAASVALIVSRWGMAATLSALDWTPGIAQERELLMRHVVTVGLETELCAVLETAATSAATFLAAEVAVGTVWAAGADLVLCAGADLPKVRRAYALDYPDPADRPAILGTAGLTAGTALVLARAGVNVEATPVQWLVSDAPAHLGRDLSALVAGRASLRLPGAVQAVTVA